MEGFDADGVGEGDVAALGVIAGSCEQGAALGDGKATEQRRGCDGAAKVEIDIAGEA